MKKPFHSTQRLSRTPRSTSHLQAHKAHNYGVLLRCVQVPTHADLVPHRAHAGLVCLECFTQSCPSQGSCPRKWMEVATICYLEFSHRTHVAGRGFSRFTSPGSPTHVVQRHREGDPLAKGGRHLGRRFMTTAGPNPVSRFDGTRRLRGVCFSIGVFCWGEWLVKNLVSYHVFFL